MKPETVKPVNWYAIYTCPNSEKKVYNELKKRQVTAFLPTRRIEKKWSDRKKMSDIPLFPNYVFVKVPLTHLWTVTVINGVVRFVSFDGKPVVIRDSEIEMVKKILSQTIEVSNEHPFAVGAEVRVKEGPLAGLTGSVVKQQGVTRLFVEFKSINQFLSINIDASLLTKAQ